MSMTAQNCFAHKFFTFRVGAETLLKVYGVKVDPEEFAAFAGMGEVSHSMRRASYLGNLDRGTQYVHGGSLTVSSIYHCTLALLDNPLTSTCCWCIAGKPEH